MGLFMFGFLGGWGGIGGLFVVVCLFVGFLFVFVYYILIFVASDLFINFLTCRTTPATTSYIRVVEHWLNGSENGITVVFQLCDADTARSPFPFRSDPR